MATITGAIVSRFDDDSDSQITTLQGLVNDMFVDLVPDPDAAMPFVVVSEITDTPISQGKDNSYRIDEAVIQFSVFSDDGNEVDDILNAIENAYLGNNLTITHRTHLSFPRRGNRQTILDDDDGEVWHGIVELIYLAEKASI